MFQRGGHIHTGKAIAKYYLKPVDNLVTFEWQHTNADFSYVIEQGIEGCQRRISDALRKHNDEPDKAYFLSALRIVCNAIVDWADKCAGECLARAGTEGDPKRREKLSEMAKTLRKVPRYGADTFEEAVQSLYLCFHFLPDSIGLPDRYLLPYYRRDLAAGRLTREHAKELLQELFTMINGFTVYTSYNADKGGESHFVVGGYLPDHEDNYNELSELILEAMMELPYYRPQVTLRWTKKLPRETLHHVLELERGDKYKRIAFLNDEMKLKALMNDGAFTFEEACGYISVGCNETAFPGSLNYGGNNSNIARSLETTLYRDTDEICACSDFDEFYTVFERELRHDLYEIFEYLDLFNALRSRDINLISSLFMDGCIERGLSATQGGCHRNLGGSGLMGYVCVIDSLSVVRQFVYDEKRLTLRELVEALKKNWEGREALRAEIMKRGKFYGNDYPEANEIAERFNRSLYSFVEHKTQLFMRKCAFGTLAGYNPHYAWFGAKTLATPDGRYNGDPFGVGIGQYSGRDREGITALLSSVAKVNPTGAIGGSTVFNLTLDASFAMDEDKKQKLTSLIEAYFKMGGLHVQLNYLSPEELTEAKKHPGDYADLRVRISGFSAYFVTLKEQIQDDVIARTRYN